MLDLSDNQVVNITPLQNLPAAIIMSLKNNLITDITPLQTITSLTSLNLGNNQVTSLAPLQSINGLQTCSRKQPADFDAAPGQFAGLIS
ncbi:MAG: leucine-rich repeat domain-containing protein [Bacteroidota bacterium]